MKVRSTIFFSLILTLLLSLLAIPSFAQTNTISSGIAISVPVQDNTKPGDIVSLTQNGYRITKQAYDPTLFGVVVENPSISFESATDSASVPVISSGKVYVNVTTNNGEITTGDFITSSDIPGVGHKATDQGYVIGTALEDFTTSNPEDIGKILVLMSISYNTESVGTQSNLLSGLMQALSAPYLSPINTIRYILAAVLVVSSFILAVTFFGKVSSLGIQAIGRNPLARKTILLGVFFHVLLAAGIIGIGIVVAYFILLL